MEFYLMSSLDILVLGFKLEEVRRLGDAFCAWVGL